RRASHCSSTSITTDARRWSSPSLPRARSMPADRTAGCGSDVCRRVATRRRNRFARTCSTARCRRSRPRPSVVYASASRHSRSRRARPRRQRARTGNEFLTGMGASSIGSHFPASPTGGMFDSLGEKFDSLWRKLRGEGKLTERNIEDALREVRLALLEADVNIDVVGTFVDAVRADALGQEVLRSLTPEQQFIKIVHRELVRALGGNPTPL